MVRSDSKIASAADLRGRTIGVNDMGGINYLMTVAVLERGGLGPDDVHWQEIGFRHMPAALEQGVVDAVWTMEPYLTVIREAGRGRVLSPGQDVLPPMSMACYVALRPWATGHPAELRAFARAYARAVELTLREPQRVRNILVSRLGLDPEVALRVAILDFRTDLTREDIIPLARLAVRHGLLAREPDIDRLLFAVKP
jgi:NitT/TauT family transport system substrate-binding protein